MSSRGFAHGGVAAGRSTWACVRAVGAVPAGRPAGRSGCALGCKPPPHPPPPHGDMRSSEGGGGGSGDGDGVPPAGGTRDSDPLQVPVRPSRALFRVGRLGQRWARGLSSESEAVSTTAGVTRTHSDSDGRTLTGPGGADSDGPGPRWPRPRLRFCGPAAASAERTPSWPPAGGDECRGGPNIQVVARESRVTACK